MRLRIRLLLLAIGAAAAVVGGAAGTAPSEQHLNVLVIETDDQTVASVRAMPNVGRLLAARGTTFVNSFVANPLCCPSRATFLTGQYSHNNGVWDNAPPTGGYAAFHPSEGNTLAVWLQRAGYATIQIGKYLNGYGKPDLTAIPPGWTDWNGAVDGTWNDYYGFTLNENGTPTRYPGRYQTDVYADRAVEAIRRYGKAGRPFFLWLCVLAPHNGKGGGLPAKPESAVPAKRDLGRFGSQPLPKPPSYNEADVSDKPAWVQALPPISSSKEAEIKLVYERQLESLPAVDRAVARLVTVLGDLHELDRTLIVFTSDNGWMTGEHRIRTDKEVVYEPSIKVPLIIRGPGVPAHRIVRTLVSNIDLAPTFVEVAGARAGKPMDGRSLLPLLRNPGLSWDRDLLIESPLHRPDRAFTAIRTSRYVYAEYATGEHELYDLSNDSNELTSVHANPAYAAIRAHLAQKLAELRTCAGSACRS